MIRWLISAALAAALLHPSDGRAFNQETPQEEIEAAVTLCVRVQDNRDNCLMQHLPEARAQRWALIVLNGCESTYVLPHYVDPVKYKANCDVSRAYIRQRWGY